MERCVSTETEATGSTEQAVAICARAWEERFDEASRVPPESAQNNAAKVLKWRDEHPDEIEGMTRTGWTRANQLANGEELSWDTIGRIAAFERHRKNSDLDEEHKGEPWKDAGYVAWLGWGGDTGIKWAQNMIDKREDGHTPQVRTDAGNIKGRMETTDEGYLRGNAIVTRTGVFEYLNADGSVRRELRHPDDVFDAESLASLSMIPVTDGHPDQLVTADTADALSVGQTGENSQIDGKHILVPFTITHSRAIESVKTGRRELSLGYRCETLPESGEYNGQAYDARQVNIRYNHLAIVDRARAGGAARINMDGAAVQSTNRTDEVSKMSQVQVNLDGITYDAAPEVAKALDKARQESEQVKADAAKTKADMQKEYDEAKAKLDALKEEMDKMKEEKSDEAIAAAVAKRLDLERSAARIVSDAKFDGLSDREVMVSVVKEARPTFDAEDKSDDYVRAAFDMAIDQAGDPDAIAKQRAATAEKLDGEHKAPTETMRGNQSRLDSLVAKSHGGQA